MASAGTNSQTAAAPLKRKMDPSSGKTETKRADRTRVRGEIVRFGRRRAGALPLSALYLEQLVEHELRTAQTVSGVARQARVAEAVDRIAAEHRLAVADREERI